MIIIIGVVFLFSLVAGISAGDNVMFNYQGRVKVHGSPFTGTGYFKFAIVNNSGNESLWSNDGTSSGGGEPTASIAISVTDGIFNVMVGDPAVGMLPINRTVFNHPSQIKLRTWFSDGTHGYQQLLPDQKLVNVELLGISSGTEDFTIFVNGTTGNDENNGLTTDTAKKTIQAAVDILPERIKANITIKVSPGIYKEQVVIEGITVKSGKTLLLVGDDTWTPPAGGEPSVRITGTDNLGVPTITRAYGIEITNVYGVEVVGFEVDYAGVGIGFGGGFAKIRKCRLFKNNSGFHGENGTILIYDTIATQNQGTPPDTGLGMIIINNAHAELFRCKCTYNQGIGLRVQNHSSVSIVESGEFSNNLNIGMTISNLSRVWFHPTYSGEIKNNTSNAINLWGYSYVENYGRNTISGNGTPAVATGAGSAAYF